MLIFYNVSQVCYSNFNSKICTNVCLVFTLIVNYSIYDLHSMLTFSNFLWVQFRCSSWMLNRSNVSKGLSVYSTKPCLQCCMCIQSEYEKVDNTSCSKQRINFHKEIFACYFTELNNAKCSRWKAIKKEKKIQNLHITTHIFFLFSVATATLKDWN